jgi:hypothetical protein
MQHRVTDDQVETVVVVRDALRVGDPAVHVEAEVRRVAQRDLDHARREVGDRALLDHTALHEVQQEEAGPTAQLHGVLVRPVLVTGDGAEPVRRVVDAALVVRDGPLLVVRVGFPVVVQHVRQFQVLAGRLDLGRRGVRVRDGVVTCH